MFAVNVVPGDGEGAHDVAVALDDVLRDGTLVQAVDDGVGAWFDGDDGGVSNVEWVGYTSCFPKFVTGKSAVERQYSEAQ